MTDIDISTITLAALLTTAGAATIAAIVTGLVAVIGRLIDTRGQQARIAAGITAVLVVLLAIQAVMSGAIAIGVPLVLSVVLAWYAVTRLAMAIYDDVTGQPASLRSQR